MPNVKNNVAAQETCRRLIDAAGQVFAEVGLHAATIHQITRRAGTNAAAVNYHFRDKFELYAAVIRHALSIAPPPAPAGRYAGTPQQRLRAHVTDLFNDLTDPTLPAWRTTLLAHEFAQPTAALDAVMDELIRPRIECLHAIVRDLLGPGAGPKLVSRCAASIGGQCFLYLYQREVVRRVAPELLTPGEQRQIIDHIVEFSLAGLRRCRLRHRPRRRRQAGIA